jgi:predicted MFS family arabinose efflux permease
MGSVVITFAPWRAIYWVQTGMCFVGLVGVIFIMPETLLTLRKETLVGMSAGQKFKTLAKWSLTNPIEMFRLLRYPNLICIAVVASALTWNQYGLLTPIRYVLNPRFGLTSPLQSGFLFLAPGVGALTGSLIGSRWADYTVLKWIRKRGVRVPEDRLRSFLLVVIILMPACQLIYGWSVEKEVGGLPVPIIFMFLTGVGQMISFPSTDTYLLDVKQERAAEVIGGNFMIKFWAAAVGSAVALPMTDAVGVGWYSTLSAGLLFIGGLAAAATAYWGQSWRDKVDEKKKLQEEQAAGGVAEVVPSP